MSTERPLILIFVCHCEGGCTAFFIRWFSVKLCFHRCCTQSAECEKRPETWRGRCWGCWYHYWGSFFSFVSTIGCFSLSRHFCLFEKLRGEHLKTSCFASGFSFWRRPKHFLNFSVSRQPCLHRCCTQSVESATNPETWCGRCWGYLYHCWWPFCTFGHTVRLFSSSHNFIYHIVGKSQIKGNQLTKVKRWSLKDRSI